jgi:hypothetical protein
MLPTTPFLGAKQFDDLGHDGSGGSEPGAPLVIPKAHFAWEVGEGLAELLGDYQSTDGVPGA